MVENQVVARKLKTLSDWKAELRLLRSVKTALIGRDLSGARAWLNRDAERCEVKAARMLETATSIENAPNLYGGRTGVTEQTLNLKKRAKKLFSEAALTREAAQRVSLQSDVLAARIDDALGMIGELTQAAADARARKRRRAA